MDTYFQGTVDAVVVDDAVVGRLLSENEGPGIGLRLFQDGDHDTFVLPVDVAAYVASSIIALLGAR